MLSSYRWKSTGRRPTSTPGVQRARLRRKGAPRIFGTTKRLAFASRCPCGPVVTPRAPRPDGDVDLPLWSGALSRAGSDSRLVGFRTQEAGGRIRDRLDDERCRVDLTRRDRDRHVVVATHRNPVRETRSAGSDPERRASRQKQKPARVLDWPSRRTCFHAPAALPRGPSRAPDAAASRAKPAITVSVDETARVATCGHTRSRERHHLAYTREHECRSRVAEGASLTGRPIRDPPRWPANAWSTSRPAQLKTMAQTGNYDWKLPSYWKLA
jgi:hypothetical protein